MIDAVNVRTRCREPGVISIDFHHYVLHEGKTAAPILKNSLEIWKSKRFARPVRVKNCHCIVEFSL